MKKRLLYSLLVLALLLVLSTPVFAQERLNNAALTLSFNGTTASCSALIKGNGAINATLELWQGNILVNSWSNSGTTGIVIQGSATVSHGQTYTLTVTGTVGGTTINATPVTGTCP